MPVAILLVRFAMCGISEDMAIQKYARTVTEELCSPRSFIFGN